MASVYLCPEMECTLLCPFLEENTRALIDKYSNQSHITRRFWYQDLNSEMVNSRTRGSLGKQQPRRAAVKLSLQKRGRKCPWIFGNHAVSGPWHVVIHAAHLHKSKVISYAMQLGLKCFSSFSSQ